MGDIRTRKINQKHLNNIKMEEKIIYFMCLLMDLSILYEITEIYCIILLSLPSWERGLKSRLLLPILPLLPSLPSWERGLKSLRLILRFSIKHVAPFVGAWIEIGSIPATPSNVSRRSLRGSVD